MRTEGYGQNNTLSPELVWKFGKAEGFMFLCTVSGMLVTHYVMLAISEIFYRSRPVEKKTVISGNTHTPSGIPEQPQHSSSQKLSTSMNYYEIQWNL
jgi:hypothetical protein